MKKLKLVAAGASLLVLERVFRALGPALAKLIRDDRRKAKELMDRVSRELLKVKPDPNLIRDWIRKVEALAPKGRKVGSRKAARRTSGSSGQTKSGTRKKASRPTKSRSRSGVKSRATRRR